MGIITSRQLERLSFTRTHEIRRNRRGNPGIRRYRDSAPPLEVPGVYLWLSQMSDEADQYSVKYVGKVSAGIAGRIGQHRSGFTGSVTGSSNRELIDNALQSGQLLTVYFRVSGIARLFGQRVSLYGSEEDAFCKWLKPEWNRAPVASVDGLARRNQP